MMLMFTAWPCTVLPCSLFADGLGLFVELEVLLSSLCFLLVLEASFDCFLLAFYCFLEVATLGMGRSESGKIDGRFSVRQLAGFRRKFDRFLSVAHFILRAGGQKPGELLQG